MSKTAERKAVAAEALYGKGDLSVNEIAENLGVSKATLYKYLHHRGVVVGSFRKSTPHPQPKTLKVRMHLVVENNSPFVRGKTRALMEIEQRVLAAYSMCKLDPKGCEVSCTYPSYRPVATMKRHDQCLRYDRERASFGVRY